MDQLLAFLETIAASINLETFVVVGAFLEEVIAPIPSPFVMSFAAVFAQSQQYSIAQLVIVLILASLAKTVSSSLVYFVSAKFGDFLVKHFGKYLGLMPDHVEKLNKVLAEAKWGGFLLFLARAIPIVPTSPVSLIAGVVRYPFKVFVLATFFGIFVRNTFFLMVAYLGWEQMKHFLYSLLDKPVLLIVSLAIIVGVLAVLMKAKDILWEKYLSALPTDEEDQKD